jgi:hypothetical protein
VVLEVDGDLTLKGWDETEVVAKSSSTEDLRIEQRDDTVHIHCIRDCLVRVPLESRVEVRRASGHATIKSLDGNLEIVQVDGELSLRGVGSVNIGRASGNLTAKNVSGSLSVRRVHGNVTLRDLEGDFVVEESVDGNLTIKEIDGNVKVIAYGNVTATLDPAPGSSTDLMSHGNLLCRLPEDASVKVHIPNAAQIQVKHPEVQTTSGLNAPYDLTLGDGDAGLILSAYGNVLIKALPPDWDLGELDVEFGEDFAGISESLSEQITEQVEGQMEFIQEQLESQLENLSTRLGSAGLTAEQAQRIAQRAQEAGERARVRAEERIQHAQEKMERKLEAARRRAESKARAAERAARDRRKRPEPVEWAVAPKAPVEPVSEEERLMILQLLEQGKITIDEAEQLLAALEGKVS